ncbi:hypothetical protein SUGI_0255510 [Cryptomeria japonica]|nr:hypothetical protein SUGI_0255510 [Cryptomeria japonica]
MSKRAKDMRDQIQGATPQPQIWLKYGVIFDANLGHVDMDDFHKRISAENALLWVQNIVSGLHRADGFLMFLESPKLMLECVHYYDEGRRLVIKEGRVYAELTVEGISRAFNIPV